MPVAQAPVSYPTAAVEPHVERTLGDDASFHPVLGPAMTGMKHEMIKFLKLKSPVFQGIESEDAYEFILNFYERLHKMSIVH